MYETSGTGRRIETYSCNTSLFDAFVDVCYEVTNLAQRQRGDVRKLSRRPAHIRWLFFFLLP